MNMTRMDGFDKLPADELPPDYKEIIAKTLSEPAAMEMTIDIELPAAIRMASGASAGSAARDRGPGNGHLVGGILGLVSLAVVIAIAVLTVKWYDGAHYLLCKGKATAELGLSFLAFNLKRAIKMVGTKELVAAIQG